MLQVPLQKKLWGKTSFPEWRVTPHVKPEDLESIGCRRRVDGDDALLGSDESDEDIGTSSEAGEVAESADDHEFALQDMDSDELGDDGREQWFPGDNESGNRVDEYITELVTSREKAGESKIYDA